MRVSTLGRWRSFGGAFALGALALSFTPQDAPAETASRKSRVDGEVELRPASNAGLLAGREAPAGIKSAISRW